MMPHGTMYLYKEWLISEIVIVWMDVFCIFIYISLKDDWQLK